MCGSSAATAHLLTSLRGGTDVTVMTSLVVHEAGHALAASCEGVRVEACGIFVWVLVPGAFVRLDLDDSSAPWKRVSPSPPPLLSAFRLQGDQTAECEGR